MNTQQSLGAAISFILGSVITFVLTVILISYQQTTKTKINWTVDQQVVENTGLVGEVKQVGTIGILIEYPLPDSNIYKLYDLSGIRDSGYTIVPMKDIK